MKKKKIFKDMKEIKKIIKKKNKFIENLQSKYIQQR